MTDDQKENYEARLRASKRFFNNVAMLSTHLDKFLNGDEKERPIVKALFDDIYIYIKKVQLAQMRNGEQIGSEFNIKERIRLNKQEAKNLENLYYLFIKLEVENEKKD